MDYLEKVRQSIIDSMRAAEERGTVDNTLDFLKGTGRAYTADIAGTPVDLRNMVSSSLSPEGGGNPYAQTIRNLIGRPDEKYSSDYFANKMGIGGEGLAYNAGNMLGPAGIKSLFKNALSPETLQKLITYHGTPHRFEPTPNNPLGEFDASKIGTGEGNQVYGHGIYLAEKPDVSKNYKLSGDVRYNLLTGGMSPMEETAFHLVQQGRTGDDLTSAMFIKYRYLLEHFKSKGELNKLAETRGKLFDAMMKAEQNKGFLYKTDLPDEMIDRMLDWDKPLSQQSEIVKKSLVDHPAITAETLLGKDIYRTLLNSMQQKSDVRPFTSEALRKLGIPGIKYLDADSRAAGAGTRNFVVFPGEEKRVTILDRKAKGGLASLKGYK